jgi:hypothetical protein
MRIHFERSGGFAGRRVQHTIDTATLPPEKAREVEGLVEASNFFALPPHGPTPAQGADRFQYRLTVADDDRQHAVQFSEAAVPPEARALLDWVIQHGKTKGA